jgi:hypothetical protein
LSRAPTPPHSSASRSSLAVSSVNGVAVEAGRGEEAAGEVCDVGTQYEDDGGEVTMSVVVAVDASGEKEDERTLKDVWHGST